MRDVWMRWRVYVLVEHVFNPDIVVIIIRDLCDGEEGHAVVGFSK
jgi:hypothetical protein